MNHNSPHPPLEVVEPAPDDEATEPPDSPRRSTPLVFHSLREMRARVAAAGPRKYLIRGLWPAGTYGVLGGEPKTLKTWNALDLAVSVASSTPWLNHFPIDDPGPVVVFAGEGGEGGIVRRLDAIARSRDLNPDNLTIAICARAPHLQDVADMHQFADALQKYEPRLVVLDPLYLAARGANLADLYSMGALLERAQHVCATVDAALMVVHHYNRSRDVKGSARMSGAGPAEWGRVLIGAKIITRHTDADTRETRVITELEAIGGDIADDAFRVVRTIRAEDPEDLDSPLHYDVDVHPADEKPNISVAEGVSTSAGRVLEVLQNADGPLTVQQIGDQLADAGNPLKKRTIQDALKKLGHRVDGVVTDSRGTTEWLIAVPTE